MTERKANNISEKKTHLCPTCGREFENFSQFPTVDVLKVTIVDPNDVPLALPRFGVKEDLLSGPTEGWRREFVPAEVLSFFNENPNEGEFIHTDNYIYYKPEGGENIEERRFYQRERNDAPAIKRLLEENSEVKAYLEGLKELEGKNLDVNNFYPYEWETRDWGTTTFFRIPVIEEKLLLSLDEIDDLNSKDKKKRAFCIKVWGGGPNMGSAGGPTLAHIFDLATVEYSNLEFYSKSGKVSQKDNVGVNTNDKVSFQLTSYGRKVYRDYVNEVFSGESEQWKDLRKFQMGRIKPEKDGTVQFQLWEIMNIFGKEMYNGNPNQVFENNQINFPKN